MSNYATYKHWVWKPPSTGMIYQSLWAEDFLWLAGQALEDWSFSKWSPLLFGFCFLWLCFQKHSPCTWPPAFLFLLSQPLPWRWSTNAMWSHWRFCSSQGVGVGVTRWKCVLGWEIWQHRTRCVRGLRFETEMLLRSLWGDAAIRWWGKGRDSCVSDVAMFRRSHNSSVWWLEGWKHRKNQR